MKTLLHCFTFLNIILIVLASALQDQPVCCSNKSLVLDLKCQNGQIPLPNCKSRVHAIYNVSNNLKFAVDNEGKYFTNHLFKVYSPNYCVANRTINFTKEKSPVILVCSHQGIWLDTDTTSTLHTVTASIKRSQKMWLLMLIDMVFCIISGVLLAITAIIYFITPQTRDIEGKCTFHLILMQCFFYLMIAFRMIARQNELDLGNNFCITHWYLSVFVQLCYFMWSAILLHYMWKKFRQNFRMDESKLLNRYRIVGYGIPALLITLCSIHAHVYSYFTKNDIERVCRAHQMLLSTLYGGLPLLIIELICVFFFVCIQRHLWIVQPTRSPENPTSSLKKLRIRLLMIAKLFTVTGLPWLLIFFFTILSQLVDRDIFAYLIRGTITFIMSEGIILFYILVIGRKHVYRGLADRFGITVRGWEQDPDSEESIDHVVES